MYILKRFNEEMERRRVRLHGAVLIKGGEVVGVLDIDSPILARFDEYDRSGLERIAEIIESIL